MGIVNSKTRPWSLTSSLLIAVGYYILQLYIIVAVKIITEREQNR
jgi:hypothetical protein